MEYYATVIKIETELFSEFFICECADTVLTSGGYEGEQNKQYSCPFRGDI